MSFRSLRWGLVCTSVALVVVSTTLTAAAKRPIKKLTYDPQAASVDLFDGIEQEVLEATLIQKNPHEGTVFIENKTDKPLTVKLPSAIVGVQVLKQPGGFFGPGASTSPPAANGKGAGQAQPIGGNFNNSGTQGQFHQNSTGNTPFGPGMPIFTVPSEKSIRVPISTVCLGHGKPDPQAKMTYKLVKVDSFTKDAALQELLTEVGSPSLDIKTAQAAAWHLNDRLTWDQLTAKKIDHAGGASPSSYFTSEQIAAAKKLVDRAEARARERDKNGLQPAIQTAEKRL